MRRLVEFVGGPWDGRTLEVTPKFELRIDLDRTARDPSMGAALRGEAPRPLHLSKKRWVGVYRRGSAPKPGEPLSYVWQGEKEE